MFGKLNPAQMGRLAFLILKAELNGFTVEQKHPLPGTFLQEADVYAACVSDGKVVKQIFVNVLQDADAAPEELEAQLTLMSDLSKKGFFVAGRDEFWVFNFGRYDVLCAHYTQVKGLDLKDEEWIRKKIAKYRTNSRLLRLYVSTLQNARLLPDSL